MKPEEKRLLIECYLREQAHKKTPRPSQWSCYREGYDLISQHGFKYETSWFGENLHPTLQKRYRRAITALEQAGLLITWKEWGLKISHIKLTPAGEKLAAEILAAEGSADV